MLTGDNGNDDLNGGDGDDVLWGGNHVDVVCGGPGDDGLNGEAGDDELWGPAASGKASGEVDALFCGLGADLADTVSTGTTTCTVAERILTTAPTECD